MKNSYPFSVLMSVYYKDNTEWLYSAFSSIFSQTYLPEEIVLVKDGILTCELERIIEYFFNKYPIFIIIQNERNLGLGASLERGLLACNYEIVARMDSDDIMPNNRFEKQYNCIKNKQYDIVSCWSLLFEDDINNIIALKRRPEYHENIVKLAKYRSPVCHAGSMFKKSTVIAAGNYKNVGFYEDYHLWVRMILNGAIFYNIQEPLYYVRTSREQISRRGGFKYAKNEIKIFYYFYRLRFYSFANLAINVISHSMIRVLPISIREKILRKIWKK